MWPLIILGAGLAIDAIGKWKSGAAAKKAGQAEAARLEYNALIADLQADDALGRGADAVSKQRAVTRGVIGTQRAGFSGQNVDVNVGSAIDVQADAALLGEIDAQTLMHNAEREAWGYQAEALDLRIAADTARRTGAAQQSAARWGAVGSTLIGSGNLLLQKYPIKTKPSS
jgi:hypothetical protein